MARCPTSSTLYEGLTIAAGSSSHALQYPALCPSFATCVLNCYRSDAKLFVDGETLHSAEGTTQGDPLSMAIYAPGTLPLVRLAQAKATQAWFADDASAGDKLVKLRAWWSSLCEHGPRYGYHANVSKTWLVVKEQSHAAATALFEETGIKITTEGRALLRAPIGTNQYKDNFISEKVDEWTSEINALANINFHVFIHTRRTLRTHTDRQTSGSTKHECQRIVRTTSRSWSLPRNSSPRCVTGHQAMTSESWLGCQLGLEGLESTIRLKSQ